MHQDVRPTRDKFLTLLRIRGPMTAKELGRELGISPSAARQHATLLQAQGLISTRHRRTRVGRPGIEYTLTPASEDQFPKAYKQVALQLLQAAHDVGGNALVMKLVAARYEHLRRKLEAEVRDLPDQERLACIATKQDLNGYLAKIERTDHQQKLVQHNCPAMDVSAQYPQFCECERQMYEELVGRPVKLDHCRSQGSHCCTFTVQF